jgi:hypothetical protein
MTSLNTRRWAHAAGFLLPLLVLILSPAPASAADGGVFSGSVTDALGNIIEDVEVLAVTMTAGTSPAAAVRSDRAGRFRFESLAPGTYRLVALKQGYLTFIGSVNTRAQSWVEVILRPAPGSASGPAIPDDTSWVLRLPRRSMLHDIDDSLPAGTAGSSAQEPVERSLLGDQLHMRVDQIFAAGANLWSNDPSEPRMQGIETKLDIASAIGERGRLNLTGSRASYESALAAGDPASTANSAAAALLVGLSYDTGPDSRLAVQAFFSDQDIRMQTDAGVALPQPVQRQLRSWGYDAGWSKQLDAISHLELQFDYQDRSLQMPESSQTASDRAIGAAGSYVTMPVVDHQIEVDFMAQLLDTPDPGLFMHGGELNRPRYGVSGLSIGLDASDTWVISGPFALLYGVGYKHALTSRDTSLIVPRVGGSWSFDRFVMRLLISHHQVTQWGGGQPAASELPFRPQREIGYEAEIELPLLAGIRLTGASSYAPLDMTFPAYDRGSADAASQPVYFTDGNAAVEQRSLLLVSERWGSRIRLEFGAGRVNGSSAPALPYEQTFFMLADRHLRYRTGKLGIHIPSSGTDLLVDWRRVMTAAPAPGAIAAESVQRSLELQIAQDLVRLRALGSWRFLMALRKGTLETGDDEDLLMAGNPLRRDPAVHQVSAGLSVLF